MPAPSSLIKTAFEKEIFSVYLDSTITTPHIHRIAHHRSKPYSLTSDGCSNYNYRAQPHLTLNPQGSKIFLGSNWGRICDLPDPVDGFILTLNTNPSPDTTPPAVPGNVRVL